MGTDRTAGRAGDAAAPPSSYLLAVLGGCSYLLLMVNWFALPAFLGPIGDEFGLSGTRAGVLVGAVPLTYVPLSLCTGLVLDRIGARRGVALAVAVFGTAGLARSFATGFPDLLAATVALAVGATGITFGLPKLVAGIAPARLLGTMSTIYVLGSYAGIAAAYGVGRGVLGPLLGGWRPTFRVLGLAALAFLAVWVPAARWHARRHGTPHGGDRDPAFTLGSLRTDAARVASHGAVRLLVVVGTAYLLVQHGLQGWLPTALEARGVGAATAATVASLFVLGQAVGTVAVPPASDRFGRRRAAVVGCGLAAVAGAGGVAVAGTAPAATAAVLIVGVGLGGVSPLLRALPTELDGVGPELTATAVALVFAVGELGGFLGPFLVGSLHDLTGSFAPGLAALALGATAMIAAGARLPEHDR